jgi:dienelactone hydrolase
VKGVVVTLCSREQVGYAGAGRSSARIERGRSFTILAYLAALTVMAMTSARVASARLAGQPTIYQIKPSDADSSIKRFDQPNVVLFTRLSDSQQLLLFLPGTSGVASRPMDFLRDAADAGYRVVSLSYNDEPSVEQACSRTSSRSCPALVRTRRIFGDEVTDRIDDKRSECIVGRLVALLRSLDRLHKRQNWGEYLHGSEPDWTRIVVVGHSQGGGMAAFIAKTNLVARVVMFSGGWDHGPSCAEADGCDDLAVWYGDPSVTPPDRWFAAYHSNERHAGFIARSYAALRIPVDHLRIFTLQASQRLSYHSSVIRNAAYKAEWSYLVGQSP